MLRTFSATVAVLGLLAFSSGGFAQSRFPQSGGAGGFPGAGGAQGGGGFGNQAGGGFGNQGAAGFGGGGGGRGGANAGGAGGRGGAGQNGMGGQPQLNAGDGSLGATIGQGNFIGQGDNTGRFVGDRMTGQRMNGASPQFGNMQQGRMQNGNRFQNGNRGPGGPAQMRQIRPQVRLGFPTAAASPPPVRANTVASFSSLPSFRGRDLNVDMNVQADGTAVLTGTVASEHERRLLESFVRLEPGIRGVRNQLTIQE